MLFQKVQKNQQNMLPTSLTVKKVTTRLSDLLLHKLKQSHFENKVTVNQSNVLVYLNRALPPLDQHWLFYEWFLRDMKINGGS